MSLMLAISLLGLQEVKSFPGGTGKEAAAWIHSLTNEPVMVNTYGAVPPIDVDLKNERKPEESKSAYIGRLIAKSLDNSSVCFDYSYKPDEIGLGIRLLRPNRKYPRMTQDVQFWERFGRGFPSADRAQIEISDGLLNLKVGNSGSIVVNEVGSFFTKEDHWIFKDGTVALAGAGITREQFRTMRFMCTPVKFDEEGNAMIDRKRATKWMLDATVSSHGQELASWAIEVKQSVYGELLKSLSDIEFGSIFAVRSMEGPRFQREFAPLTTAHQAAIGFHQRARSQGPYEGDNTRYLQLVREVTFYGDADSTHPVLVVLAEDGRLAFAVMTKTGNQQVW